MGNLCFLKYFTINFIWNFLYTILNPSMKNFCLLEICNNNKAKSSWIKRLYDTTTHRWKIMPTFFIRKKLGKNFIFHSNLSINPNKIKEFPTYYQDIFIKWEKHFLSSPSLPFSVASQCLGHNNKYIKIDDKTTLSSSLSATAINIVGQLFQNNQQIKKMGWTQNRIWFN